MKDQQKNHDWCYHAVKTKDWAYWFLQIIMETGVKLLDCLKKESLIGGSASVVFDWFSIIAK